MRSRRRRRALRRLARLVLVVAVLVVLVVTLRRVFERADTFGVPSSAALAGLSVRQRVVAIAESQVGYATDPLNSYCNKFSAYWDAGTPSCPNGEKAEEWCADFAAWVWHLAGAHFTYGYRPGEINGGAASFYEWGVANGEWHPAGSGYVAAPGDVAVYGLSLAEAPTAAARGDRHQRPARHRGAPTS